MRFSAATLLVSLPLAAVYGLTGAVWSGVLPALAFAITSVVMLRRASAGRAEHESKRAAAPVDGTTATPAPATPEGVTA